MKWQALAIAGIALAVSAQPGAFGSSAPLHVASQAQEPTGALELLFDQGKRLADTFKYEEAIALFDRVIQTLTTAGPEGGVQKPDLLVQAYEQRARARFAFGDSPGAEQDFAGLLALKPDFKLDATVSPKVMTVLENVRRLTVGQLALQLTPPGEITISGRAYTVGDVPLIVDLKSGDHRVSASRTNFTPFEQTITVNPNELAALSIALERVAATVSVVTSTEDVEVWLDGVSKGRTQPGGGAGAPAALDIPEVALGDHKVRLVRDCYVDRELTVTVGAEDVRTEPIELTRAVATVVIESEDRQARVVVDGEARGPIGSDLTVCAGPHVIEVRGERGRFVDRREWKTGDAVTLVAELRNAVPILIADAGTGTPPDQLRASLEQALARTRGVLFYAPVGDELEQAIKAENVPSGWMTPAQDAAAARVPREVSRDIVRRVTARLGVQGLAVVSVGADSYSVSLRLLAAGSGEPDVLTMSLSDAASQGRVVERLSIALPPLVQPSLDASLVDVAGTQGAVVVRANAASGLAVGDVVTSAAGRPVTSVADLQAALVAHNFGTPAIALEVTGPEGASRKVASGVARAVDTLPVRDPGLLANRALLALQDAIRTPGSGVDRAAVSINLALVHMRLGSWDEALEVLKDVQPPVGPGVSAGTVAYFNGLALENLGRTADALAAFSSAAAAPQARLWFQGPLVAPLARARLQSLR